MSFNLLQSSLGDELDDDHIASSTVDTNPVLVMLFLFAGLGLGVLIEQGISHTKIGILAAIPPSIILFIVGIMMAGISKSRFTGDFNASLADWIHINADMMLFIFLPPLVFGEAMNLPWYQVKAVMPQCLLLAIPGVLLGTAIMGMLTKLLLGSDVSWLLCMLFASTLAATDTVAVLSIMQSLGSSPKLTLIIVGESLFNDGTGMVCFVGFLHLLENPNTSVVDLLGFAASMTLGSISLGFAIGLITVYWLKSANRPLKEVDVAAQIAITIIVAYLTFFLAQYVLKISGILSLVGAALVLSYQAPPIILNRDTMHHIWSFIEWIANTLIFLLTGLIIGHRILGLVAPSDWLYMFILYLFAQVTRVVVVTVLYPALKVTGNKMTLSEAIFCGVAGLRGALGMALGLIIVEYADVTGIDPYLSKRIFFYVGGIVALSLLINGSLCGYFLDKLGLASNTTVQQMLIMDQLKKKMRRKILRMVERMEKELDIGPEDMSQIRMSCSILRPSMLDMDLIQSMSLAEGGDTALSMSMASRMGYPNNISQQLSMSLSQSQTGARAALTEAVLSGSDRERRSQQAQRLQQEQHNRQKRELLEKQQQHQELRNKNKNKKIRAKHKAAAPTATATATATVHSPNDSDMDLTDDDSIGTRVQHTDITEESWLDPQEIHGAKAYGNSGRISDPGERPQKVRGRSSTYNNAYGVANRQISQEGGVYGRTHSKGRTFSIGNYLGVGWGDNGEPGRNNRYSTNSQTGNWLSEQRQDEYDQMNRMLDPGNRKNDHIIPEMLAHVRTVFLEIVRVKYWKLIELGKLPRNDHIPLFLLYTIDAGIDEAALNPKKSMLEREAEEDENRDGLGDWKVIQDHMDRIPLGTNFLQWCEGCLPSRMSDIATNILENRQRERDKSAVYMLTAFIEAHEHAQKKIHSFIGVEADGNEDIEESSPGLFVQPFDGKNDAVHYLHGSTGALDIEGGQGGSKKGISDRSYTMLSEDSEHSRQMTPEEAKVKAESAHLVDIAKRRLDMLEEDTIAEISTQQAAMTVLARERDLVTHMSEEGLLNGKQAELFLEEISADRHLIEQSENLFRRRKGDKNEYAGLNQATVLAPLIDTSINSNPRRDF